MPPANFTPHRGAAVRPVSFKGIFLRRRESHRKEIRGLAAPASVCRPGPGGHPVPCLAAEESCSVPWVLIALLWGCLHQLRQIGWMLEVKSLSESELFFFNLGKRAVNDKRSMYHGKAVPII